MQRDRTPFGAWFKVGACGEHEGLLGSLRISQGFISQGFCYGFVSVIMASWGNDMSVVMRVDNQLGVLHVGVLLMTALLLAVYIPLLTFGNSHMGVANDVRHGSHYGQTGRADGMSLSVQGTFRSLHSYGVEWTRSCMQTARVWLRNSTVGPAMPLQGEAFEVR